MPHVQGLLDANPQNWRDAMNLVTVTETFWVQKLAAGNLMYEEALRRQLTELKSNLLGPQFNALEKVLVDRIAAAWLGVAYAEQDEAANVEQTNCELSRLRMQRLESANRRMLACSKSLAQVRRLAAGLKIEITHAVPPPAASPAPGADMPPASEPASVPWSRGDMLVAQSPNQPVEDVAQRLRGFLAPARRTEAMAMG